MITVKNSKMIRSAELRRSIKKDAGIQEVFIQRRKIFAYTNSRSAFQILPLQHLFALFAFAYEINFLCFGLGDAFFGKESLI